MCINDVDIDVLTPSNCLECNLVIVSVEIITFAANEIINLANSYTQKRLIGVISNSIVNRYRSLVQILTTVILVINYDYNHYISTNCTIYLSSSYMFV